MKSSTNLKKFFLLAGDIAVLYFSLYLTLLIRYFAWPTPKLWEDHFLPFTLIFLFWIVVFYIAGLYDLGLAINNRRFWQLTGRSLIIASLFSIAFFYLLPDVGIAPKTNLLIYIAVFSAFLGLWRQFFNWSLKSYLPKNKLAIIGFNDQVKELIEELKLKSHLGYSPAFIIDDQSTDPVEFENIPIKNNLNGLPELVRENKITTMVLSSDPHQSVELRNALFSCLPLKISYVSLPIFYENLTGKVPISLINQMWFLENLSEGGKTSFDVIKRAADLMLALILFLVSLIFWLPIILIIKLESRGPIFFLHTRLGQNGQPFTFYKFRSMRDAGVDHLMPTAKNDSRITRFGMFMRKTRIDEIPQLINVIKGDMSFVGPRPERPELVRELEKDIPFYRERMLVKPGITGWDQISGEYHSPSHEDTIKKLQYDLYYIKNRSTYLDLSIVLRTIYTIISKSGI